MRRFLVTVPVLMLVAHPASAQNSPQRDPDAIAALERMGASLRNLHNFALHADITRDQVLTTGQKLKQSGTIDAKARRPNGLWLEVKSDRQDRVLYYDGRTATLFSPRVGYYANWQAPPTIREMLKAAADRLGVDTPLSDLFDWGSDPAALQQIQSAFRVDTETIGGQPCDHYAMRQAGSDWQIWIHQGAEALPCRLVITTTDDPSMPEFSATYTWTPQAKIAPADFSFVPPANARKIAIRPSSAAGAVQ